MGKLFVIIGKSATGKDTIFRMLRERGIFGTIVPYTTRPKRSEEENGREYFFVDEDQMKEFDKQGKIVEKRCYHTIHGDWNYFTVDDGQFDLEKKDYLMINTLEGFGKIRTYFGKDKVVPIYIYVEEGERLLRAVERERSQSNPKYQELCRRFLADEKDFSEEKLEEVEIYKRYNNENLQDCIEKILEEIL